MFKSQIFYVDCVDKALKVKSVSVQHIVWSFPEEGQIKANLDCSVNHLEPTSCGGLLRNHMGQFFGGFAANLGSCPIAIAEVWGAYYALHMAWQQGHKKVLLEVDSTTTVALIHKSLDGKHPLWLCYCSCSRIDEKRLTGDDQA